MSDGRVSVTETKPKKPEPPAKAGGFFGSLKDALAAAARDDPQREARSPEAEVAAAAKPEAVTPKLGANAGEPAQKASSEAAAPAARPGPSAAEAAREVKGQASIKAQHVEPAPPTTRVVREAAPPEERVRTQLVRGKMQVKRGTFQKDPVVGWLVIVGGPGIGSFRPIFEGNNTVGRSPSQRIPLDFGDDAISAEEQAYIRYDSSARSFLFVPNLAKTNIVYVNDKRPTGAVELNQMDVITMGRTQLVFVPFCGAEFDWAELTDAKD
jgi:FHA domain